MSSSVSGTPISGATVSTQPATSVATTDSAGNYSLTVPAATYNVIFTAAGYNANFIGSLSAPTGGTAVANQALVPVPSFTNEDLFSRPDQTGLGTASDGSVWVNDLSRYPTAKATIAGRQAFVQTNTAYTDYDTWMGTAYRDEEVAVDMNMVSVFNDPSFQHGGRVLARVLRSDSWIVMAINPSNNTLTLWVDDSGNWTQIGGLTTSFSLGTWYHAKLDVIGSRVYGKAWQFGTAEPGWQVTGSQLALTAPGVGGFRTGAADVYFNNFTTVPITQIGGTITDSRTGSPIAGAPVSLSNGATTATDSRGNYVFGGLATGSYSVTSAPTGYNAGSVSAAVNIGVSATANLALLATGSPPPGPTPTPTPGG